MTATKTNERPGTKAVLRHSRQSASKARAVLDVIRGMEYIRARDVLTHLDRAAAVPIGKLLHSCAANAEHNDGLDPNELYVASCFADEGTTLKRWRPRARGRATRIRKRTCHITVILARMPDEQLTRLRAKTAAEQADRRARRVSGGRRREAAVASAPVADRAAAEVAPLVSDDELEPVKSEAVEVEAVEVDAVEPEAVEVDAVEPEAIEVESIAVPVESEELVEASQGEVAAEEIGADDTTSDVAEDADASTSDADKGAN
jgi:large subunit ribosomal protein L22